MALAQTTITLTGLGKKRFEKLRTRAKRLGMTPDRYVSELVAQDLAMEHKVRITSIRQIMGPGRSVDEAELDALVEAAREDHFARSRRKK
jgi:hypothetical protein